MLAIFWLISYSCIHPVNVLSQLIEISYFRIVYRIYVIVVIIKATVL